MKTTTTFFAVAPAVLAALIHPFSAFGLPGDGGDPVVEFERYTLNNGLEVILHQDNSVPLVAVNVWYHVGSGDETPGKSGFAHLFEHMLFQGSTHVGEDQHFAVLKTIGASGVNGSTNSDRTDYYEVVPSHQLEVGLWLESDRMGHLLPLLTEKSLQNQIEVVRNERRQNYDQRPYGNTRFAIAQALYPEGHPYRYLTIGRHEDLVHASAEDVVNFYRTWYVPANATLTLAGDFEIDEAKRLVEKWFGSFPAAPKPTHSPPPMPSVAGPTRTVVEDTFAKLRRIDYAWHSPAMFDMGDAELDLVASALAAPGTGRLYKTLVHEMQLAQRVRAYQASRGFHSYFQLSVTVKTGADLDEIEQIVQEEIERIRGEGITREEFDRAVVQVETQFIWGLESLHARAGLLQRYNHYVGSPDFITQDLDRYRTSSLERVRDAAWTYLAPAGRVEVLTVPGTSAPKESYRDRQPDPAPPRDFQLPSVATFSLGDDIDVYLVERHTLPTISLELEFDGGSVNDPRGKEGMASVCMDMMSEGTERLDKLAFREALADIGSRISSRAGRETQSVSMSTVSKHFEKTFDLFEDTVLWPGFREADLERMVRNRVESLKQDKGAAASVAARLQDSVGYGPDHPFGRLVTEASLEAITLDDCIAYHADYVRPAGARLFVVGDITERQIREAFAPMILDWRGTPEPGTVVVEPRPREGRVFLVDVPGSPQTTIVVMHPGPRRTDPAYFATSMMSAVLGGSFSSRLNMNLREDKGYTYGARGGFRYNRTFGSFNASASVRADATLQSIQEIFAEIQGLQSGAMAVTPEELEREKAGAILGLPARFATAGAVLNQYSGLVFYGLPLDYYNRYMARVDAVTLSQVEQAARTRLYPSQAKILVVGDARATQMEHRVDAQGQAADVPKRDAEGNPVTLEDGLRHLLASGALGPGGMVVLDVDGHEIDTENR